MSDGLLKFLSLTEVWVGALGLAAFLALFWVLRGAPVGQAVLEEDDQEAPRGGYRDRVVAAVAVGLLLIFAGGWIAVTRGALWSVPAFVLGFGTVFSLVLINQRYRHGSPTLRRTVDLSTATLNAALFAGILVVVNVIAFRYGGQPIDMTGEGAYSLSSLTRNQLRTLQQPVTFTMFFGRSGVAAQQRDRVGQLLELFRSENPAQIHIESVDPYRDLTRYDALIKRVPAVDVTQGGGVVVEYGEGEGADREVVRNVDLFVYPRAARFDPDAERFETKFTGEDALSTALIRLREGKKPRIVFTTGHGEPSLDDTDTSKPGLGIWKSRLMATGSQVETVNLLAQDVPDGTSVIVIAGPKTAFKPEEAGRLKAFADQKGPILMLVGDTAGTGLEEVMRTLHVELGKGFIVEPRLNVRGNPTAVVVQVTSPTHPIVAPLANELLYFPRPTPLKTFAPPEAPGKPPMIVPVALFKTTPQSWAEPDLESTRGQRDASDEGGPLIVGVAVADRPEPGAADQQGKPRLVIFSSRYAGENAVIQASPTNLDLLMNSVNWLRGKGELQGKADAKVHVSLTLMADPTVRTRLVLVPTVMAVLLIVTLGVTTYLARRA